MTTSIIVPTYRRPQFLRERCLPSILGQTRNDWDCHVIGDGTDAESADLVLELASRDPRFRFTNLPHADYPADPATAWCVIGINSLNHGLETATGDYVAVLADDDAWASDFLETLAGTLDTRPEIDFAYGQSLATWANGELQSYGKWPPGPGAFCDGAYVYRRSLDYRYEWAALERGMVIDMDLWTRMVAGGVRFAFIPRVIHLYYPYRQK